ncbi:MAG: IS66 family transposase [Candidatus Hydrothermarchaeales archaeon]
MEDENRKFKDEKTALKQDLAKALKRIEKLEEENQHIREENQKLKEDNQKLRLTIYGIKPSKKDMGKNPEEGSTPKPKKRGPPQGHEGTSRRRPERVDKTVVLRYESCPDCGGEISELEEPRLRYMEDIVPVPLFVTEYVIKQGYCPACKKVVYPEVPETIGNRHFGIQFLLYITYLRFVLNLPYNKIVQLLNDTYQAGVSEGTLINYIKLAAEIFGPEYEQIKHRMRELENCHYDDTGQRVDGKNRWLWVFINKEAVLYHTSKNRGKKVVIEILGEDYEGVTVQDFYPSFDGAPGTKQKCWSHLIKDARELAEKKKKPPGSIEFHEGLRGIFHDAKEAEKDLSTVRERKKIYRRFVKRLKKFAKKDYMHEDVKRLAKRCLKYRHEMFTFILVPGLEPTNNVAERAIRPCVVQRKISGCHRTYKGAESRDVIMSVMGTMKLQGKDFLNDGKEHVLNTLA